ncbi:MAG: GAF domain-containing protein [Anaerolineae bacterium]|nr:GAF domain-containing protein [Anaerolineae bacterium]
MDRLDDTPLTDQQSPQASIAELRRLYQEARDAHRRSSFLAEASTILSSSLDYAARLSGLVRFVVPYLADWCVIDMIDDEAQVIRRLAIAHTDPTKQDTARRFQQKFSILDRDATHTITAVLDSGQTWCDFDVSEERFTAQARDAEHLQLLRELGFASEIVVPIIVRGQPTGTITLVRGQTSPHYTPDDTAMAEELARRTAVAVDQAWLYYEARQARQAAERAVERTNRLQAITAALSEALTPPQVVETILPQIIGTVGAAAGFVTLLTNDETALELVGATGYPPEVVQHWSRIPLDAPLMVTDAVRSKTPIWIEVSEDRDARYPPIKGTANGVNSETTASLPLIVKDRTVGAMGVNFVGSRLISEEDRAFLHAVAQQCAQALDRARLYNAESRAREETQTAEQRLTFLAEASYILNTSLDYQATLDRLAHLVLPILADYCAIDVITPAGEVKRVAVAHRNPDKAALMAQMRAYPPPIDHAQGSIAALRTGLTTLVPDIPDDLLVAVSYNEAHLQMMRDLQPRSSVGVPIIARGRTLGSIMLVMSESGRTYRPDDVALAEEVARRAAVAIDNAMLYQQAQEEIARRNQVEANLRSQQTQLRLITDALPVLVSYIGNDQRYRFNNRMYATWFGYQPQDLLGKHMREVIGETAFQRALPHIQAVLSGQDAHFENILPHSDGSPRHVDTAFIPHFAADNQVEGFFVVGLDTTERKQAEVEAAHRIRQLSVLNRVLQAVLEPAQLNETLDILLQEICDIFHVDAADIHFVNHDGQLLSLMAHRGYSLPAGAPADDIPLQNSIRGEAVQQGRVVQYSGAALAQLPSATHYRPLEFGTLAITPLWVRETIIGTLAIYALAKRELHVEEVALLEALGRSIGVTIENARLYTEVQLLAETLQRKVEERTEELQIALLRAQSADNAKSVMISTVSHEMRTPLSSIIGFSNLILSRKPEQAKVLDYVTAINVEARRLADLVNDFLDLQRIEAGREVFRYTELDLGGLIRDVVNKQVLGENSPHRLRLDLKPVPRVYADSNRIRQVLINLLTNAIKYSPGGGEIVLSLEQRPDAVVFSIRDQGLGIPADEIGHIFEVFHRGRVAERQRIRGTGLGLALSRRIIASHNGQIWVESAGANQGSTFSFSLPLTGQADTTTRRHPAAAGKQIVVIEDDQNFSTYLAERLEPEGFSIHLLRFETATPQVLMHLAPDLIVLDILQGDQKPGWGLLIAFKQHPATRTIPIIVCSALNDSGEAVQMGAAAHITKPIDEAALLRQINRLIDHANPIAADPESSSS